MKPKLRILSAVLFLTGALIVLALPPEYMPADSELGKVKYVAAIGDHKIITRVPTQEKVISLTFDDGPDPRFTPEVLDILKLYGIRATFFVVGENALLYPELIQRQVQEGHEIENHTFTHPVLLKKTDLTPEEEILWCQQAITRLTLRLPLYFRPPRKMYDRNTVELCDKFRYRMVLWTVCLENKNALTAELMADRVVKYCRPGAIILAHDGFLDRSKSVQALPLLIEKLKKEGYKFVTLHELLTQYDAEIKSSSPDD